MMDLDELLKNGDLKQIRAGPAEIKKELAEAEKDLKNAGRSASDGNWKWAIIQAYYSMFHAARAVLLKNGYRERSHYAVVVFLEYLHKTKKLESYFIDDFRAAKFAREEADYASNYSGERAEQVISTAGEFITRMKKLLHS